jgi:hypothetical protein
METQDIAIVSIHPDPARPLAWDFKDILESLRPYWDRWVWCVRNLDWLGENCELVCQRVEAAGCAGVWMSSQELYEHARNIYQTLEGEFLAFPQELPPSQVTSEDLDLRSFPTSRAELAIVAVDGAFFEVCAKDHALLGPLRKFRDIRNEDPSTYF